MEIEPAAPPTPPTPEAHPLAPPPSLGLPPSPSTGGPEVKRASYALLAIVAIASLAADLGTKWWAKSRLSGFDAHASSAKHVQVIKNHADFIFAQNPGGAWSFLRSVPDALRRPFFLIIS